MEVFHGTATECHLPYGITQCYLLPDTSEHAGWYCYWGIFFHCDTQYDTDQTAVGTVHMITILTSAVQLLSADDGRESGQG